MKTGNEALYETEEVVHKYATLSARVRLLNNAEIDFIQRFQVLGKRVLVLGSGAGRVPANLFLLGNDVTAVEYSEKLHAYAKSTVAPRYNGITFLHGDARVLEGIPDADFDVVFFPMNGLGYNVPLEERNKVLRQMARKVRPGGIIAFSSHNSLGTMSYKSSKKRWPRFGADYVIEEELVVGGGVIFKGNPTFVIRQSVQEMDARFLGFCADARNGFERKASRRLYLAKWVFPYLLYVFRKEPSKTAS